MKRPATSLPALLALLCAGAGSAWAQQQTFVFQDGVSPSPGYAGTRDVTLAENTGDPVRDPNANYDAQSGQVDGFPSEKAVLLRFDVSRLPPGTTVTDVTLQLDISSATSDPYLLFQVLVPWAASQATWNVRQSGVPWTVPGAQGVGSDHGSAVHAIVDDTPTGDFDVPLDAAGVSVVQGWVDNPSSNHGFILKNYDSLDGLDFGGCDATNLGDRLKLTVWHGIASLDVFRNGEQGYAGCTDTVMARGPTASGNTNGLGHQLQGGTSGRSVALLRFDLGALPAGTQVLSAELALDVRDPSSGTFNAYEVLRDWDEAAATWTSIDGSQSWLVPGLDGAGDRGSTVLGTFSPSNTGTRKLTFNAAGVALVQAWLSGARPNRGIVLTNLSVTDDVALRDRESGVVGGRPALTVVVSLPDGGVVVVPDAGTPDAGPGGTADAGVDGGGFVPVPDGGPQDPGGGPGPGGGDGTSFPYDQVDVACSCGHAGAGLWLGWLALGLGAFAAGRRRRR